MTKNQEKMMFSDKKDNAKRERSSVRVNCGMYINFRKQKKDGRVEVDIA